MVKSKLYEEALRSFSYALAHDLLDRVIRSCPSSDTPSLIPPTTPIPSPSDSPSRIQTSLLILPSEDSCDQLRTTAQPMDSAELLSQKLEEKEEVIRQLRSQLETLQRQMDSLQKSAQAGNPSSSGSAHHPIKRKLRSLHQIHGEELKVNYEDVDSCSENLLEICRSDSKDASTPHTEKPLDDKTPSLQDLHLHAVLDTLPASKANIFNVEYEEFAQQLKLELAPNTPANVNKTPEEMMSPDFRPREIKPVMNWSNLQSPRDASVLSPQTDSSVLKEAESAAPTEQVLIYKHIPQPRKRSKPPHPSEKEINFGQKVRAKSQSHAAKQPRPSDEVLRKDNHVKSPKSAGTARTGTSIKGGKKQPSPRAAEPNIGKMNKTTSSFPSSHTETKPDLKSSSSFRNRKYNSKSQLVENKPPYKGRQVLDELLYNEDMCDQKSWNGIMKKMKENPALLSRLLNEGMEGEEKFHSESTGSGLGEHRKVFTKVTGTGERGKPAVPLTPVKAVLPVISFEKRFPDVSNSDLNCVLEEDEDSSRSHFDPLPELYQSKPSSFRASSLPPRPSQSSVPKTRVLQTNKDDWCESSLDSFVLGGNSGFNWDRRPTIFTEREIDVTYLRLHGNELEPGELKSLFSKAKNTVLRLMDELMLQDDYLSIPTMSIEGAIFLLKHAKKMVQFRRLTITILESLHQREDQILTLMSLDDEASPERQQSARAIAEINKVLLGLISQWRHSGFPFKAFVYLNVVSDRQDYAEKIQEESGEWLVRNGFGVRD